MNYSFTEPKPFFFFFLFLIRHYTPDFLWVYPLCLNQNASQEFRSMQTVRMIFKFCQEQKWGTSQVRKCKQKPTKQWQQVSMGEQGIRGMCYWKCTTLWTVGLKENSAESEALKTQDLECGIWACRLLRHRGAHLGPSTAPLTGNRIFEQICFHNWWVSIPYALFFCCWNMAALRWAFKVLHS